MGGNWGQLAIGCPPSPPQNWLFSVITGHVELQWPRLSYAMKTVDKIPSQKTACHSQSMTTKFLIFFLGRSPSLVIENRNGY